VAVSPPVTPASTSGTASGPTATRRSTSFFRSPVRHTLPAAAAAAVACLFVAVASPQTALAAAPERTAPALGTQHFVADGSSPRIADRDGFSVGRSAAALRAPSGTPSADGVFRPTVGAVPEAGGFGARWVVGCAACSTSHQGVDFAAANGTPVVAALPGRVVSAGVLGGYGNQILLQHADGTQTRYGHLSAIGVQPGQTVVAGQRIGAVGNTGVSTGAHLHFEVIVAGTPIDPAAWLQARGLL
jgi:murein DD-endopeptidase MepM/ murein hydrolase activator NlpD